MADQKLPEDVIRDILSLLPAKSLVRFTCVCKTWLDLIKSHNFITLHLNRAFLRSKIDHHCHLIINPSIGGNVLLLHSNIESLDDEFLSANHGMPFLEDLSSMQLLNPCNGILCFTDCGEKIVLCNPAIRETKTLPIPQFPYPDHLSIDVEATGFGFDPKTSDYKVVRIVELFDEEVIYRHETYKAQVYNLSTNTWRQIGSVVPAGVFYMPCFETSFNESLHWYAMNGDDNESILAFHLSDEVFRKIPFPDCCSCTDGYYRSLVVLNETLALILYEDLRDQPDILDKNFDIWLMKDYGVKESWTRYCRIGPLSGVEKPLALWNNSEFLLETCEGQLGSCDLQSQKVKRFQVYGVPTMLEAFIYSESLVSIKSENEV